MSIFEKSIQSFVSNANTSLVTGAPAPIICIADTLPYPSHPILHSIMTKITSPQTPSDSSTIPITIAITHSSHPFFHTATFPNPIITLTPTFTTYTELFTPQTLLSKLYTIITANQTNNNTNTSSSSSRPVIISIDSLPLILESYHPLQIPSLIKSILTIPTVSGIVFSVSTDALLYTSHTTIQPLIQNTTTLSSPFYTQNNTNPIDIFDNISSIATTLFQTLPPPSANIAPTAILSCRVTHRSSNGKISSDVVPLQPHQTKPTLITAPTHDNKKGSSTGGHGNNDPAALPDGLKDLPFNLTLTPHQIQQRAQVELPYAHQGAVANANTSATRNMGLLSSAPINKKSTQFDEVVDDDDDEEDSEL